LHVSAETPLAGSAFAVKPVEAVEDEIESPCELGGVVVAGLRGLVAISARSG